MLLLERDDLIKTSDLPNIEEADWNYRFILGFFQRLRFKLAISLLSGQRFDTLLEIGYGSGIFLPELAKYCKNLFGVDQHRYSNEIMRILLKYNVQANLISGDATKLLFKENFADCIVIISTLEYISDLDSACENIRRVLTPNGLLIVVTPGFSPIVDLGFRLLSRSNALQQFGDRRRSIIATLKKYFSIDQMLSIPAYSPKIITIYNALKLINIK